jgi:hypothetical protein
MDISNNSWGIGSGRSQYLEDTTRRAGNAATCTWGFKVVR